MVSQMVSGILPLILRVPFVLLSIVIHELSHGLVAYKMGDPTAKRAGRLSFNPIKHIDPLGAVSMLLFRFGWAKPVPVNPNYFRRKRLGMILVSLAGPVANMVFAFLVMCLWYLFAAVVPMHIGHSIPVMDTVNYYIEDLYWLNLSLAVFNLIPIPPLDGSKILGALLPEKWESTILRYERYGMIVLFVLIFASGRWNPLGNILGWGVTLLHEGIFYIIRFAFSFI